MKRFAIVTGICASFLLGAAMTAVAQDEHRDENAARPAQQEPRQDQARPDDRPNGERPKQADEDRRNEDRRNENRPQENRQSGDRRDMTPQGEGRQQDVQSGDRHDRPAGREHGRHIADNDFRVHFGRDHRFAPGRLQVVNGRSQFIYGGYTFVLVDGWPADWAYDSDDCYVDYIDGDYYLFNVRYPGVRILLLVL